MLARPSGMPILAEHVLGCIQNALYGHVTPCFLDIYAYEFAAELLGHSSCCTSSHKWIQHCAMLWAAGQEWSPDQFFWESSEM